jgi:hypothetical protein
MIQCCQAFPLLLLGCLLCGEDASPVILPSIEVPRLTVAPLITADEQDQAWNVAAVIPGLSLSRRSPPQAHPIVSTTVRLGWDPAFLYLRFICADEEVFQPVQGRDAELYRGDAVEVFLDVVGDGAAVVELQFSPGGDAFDQMILLTAPLRSNPDGTMPGDLINRDMWTDRSWNMEGLRWAAKRSLGGWTVDATIPAVSALRRLGIKTWKPMPLRCNLLRYDWLPTKTGRDLLAMNWSTVQYGCPHISPARMGTLRLLP